MHSIVMPFTSNQNSKWLDGNRRNEEAFTVFVCVWESKDRVVFLERMKQKPLDIRCPFWPKKLLFSSLKNYFWSSMGLSIFHLDQLWSTYTYACLHLDFNQLTVSHSCSFFSIQGSHACFFKKTRIKKINHTIRYLFFWTCTCKVQGVER